LSRHTHARSPANENSSNSGLERVRPEALDRDENSEREQNRVERHVTQLVASNMREAASITTSARPTAAIGVSTGRIKNAAGRTTPTAPRTSTVPIPLISRSVKILDVGHSGFERGARLSELERSCGQEYNREKSLRDPNGCVHGSPSVACRAASPSFSILGKDGLAGFRASGTLDSRAKGRSAAVLETSWKSGPRL
jgi:hypothetical protein